ncbi:MAG: crossover junction endodeoxyribonuclease RuvC [Candidatus Hydrogenedentota bacterium]|nr:MAG: crossover junction endodeoxyribonuclease RuvC [Candidatus Hydrogenedentota bacterium]
MSGQKKLEPSFFLGIDPGYGRLGFAITQKKDATFQVVRLGILETDGSKNIPERLLELEQDMLTLLKPYRFASAAVEQVFFRKNLTTGVNLLQARGVVLLTLSRFGIRIKELTPTGVKKLIAGNGRATKKQVQNMTARLCNLKSIPKPDDAADALALSIAAAISDEVKIP